MLSISSCLYPSVSVKEKITAIEDHVEYAQSEFQTLHNETIPAFEDKLMDETNQFASQRINFTPKIGVQLFKTSSNVFKIFTLRHG
jgi:hypothetical protein